MTFDLWELVAFIIGKAIVGLGVIPMAFLATVVNGLWSEFGLLFLLAGLTIGVRFLGISMAEK